MAVDEIMQTPALFQHAPTCVLIKLIVRKVAYYSLTILFMLKSISFEASWCIVIQLLIPVLICLILDIIMYYDIIM